MPRQCSIKGIFFLSLLVLGTTMGEKILIISMQAVSQCLEISTIGQELTTRGHDVVIFLDSTLNHKNCYERGKNGTNKIRPVLFKRNADVKGFDYFTDKLSRSLQGGEELPMMEHFTLISEIIWNQCAALFSDQAAIDLLKDERFDFAIVQGGFFSYCFFVLPYKLNLKYVTVGSAHDDIISARPFLPSIVPELLTQFTNEMSFSERLINSVIPMVLHAAIRWNTPMDVINTVAPELSTGDVINLASMSELFLYNYDTVLSYPVPTMPNHILVGGLSAGPAGPLSGIFKEFYNEAKNGVIVVTFGSIIDALPLSVTENLMIAFKKMNIAVLWKHTTVDSISNVKRVDWLPQNDLLGHPKTRLFVSHCGNNGVFEALYHGVPLVCTPIDGDQFYNGRRVQRWNAGISVPLLTSSSEILFNAINEVLNNSTYGKNMKKASEIYHSRPETARERAAFWIEHVLKFGGDHLRSPASNMSVFIYRGYDVLCFVLVCGIVVILLIAKTIVLLCRCCFCRRQKLVKTKTS